VCGAWSAARVWRYRTLATADWAGLGDRQGTAPTGRALIDVLEDAEQLADAADEQPLLVDLDPRAGGSWEHDVVPGSHRHLHADVIPPIEPGADGQHDAVLGRRLVAARWNEQPRSAYAIRIKLLDHDTVE
jgi:hypothetical protein